MIIAPLRKTLTWRVDSLITMAMVLVEAGAAVLVDDAKDGQLNAACLGPVLAQLMGDDARREQMSRCAMALDRPDSAETIAGRLLAAEVPRACDSCSSAPVKFVRRRSA